MSAVFANVVGDVLDYDAMYRRYKRAQDRAGDRHFDSTICATASERWPCAPFRSPTSKPEWGTERQGFVRSDPFELRGWRGQVLTRQVGVDA